ncbi:MAG TPA: 1-acyl-sn-glycerol-3-phosphate acyltransferase [Thermoanaerobaculia bacterium]|nr:1-acyl-sn-glycerol-3-phosphate acyltransferase [Thermoanaerobaculia bacterium]
MEKALEVLVVGPDDVATKLIAARLGRRSAPAGDAASPPIDCRVVANGADVPLEGVDVAIYRPRYAGRRLAIPDPADLDAFLAACTPGGPRRVVLVSSAAACPPRHDHPGYTAEAAPGRALRRTIAQAWLDFEERAAEHLGVERGIELVVLRPAALASADSNDYLGRLLRSRIAFVVAGYDPTVQLLAPEDLAEAVAAAVVRGGEGTYHVVPRGAVSVRAALRLAGVARIALPITWHRAARAVLAPLGLADPAEQVEAVRHPATVSGARSESELGFVPRHSSARAILDARGRAEREAPEFDDFGLSYPYIRAYGRTLFRFLHRVFWRVEVRGIENVPREGRAMLVGVHRGFMPWDGVMALHAIVEATGRAPRFLIHPTLVKFPFLANYMTKLGGVIANQENSDRLLARGELLGFYPEGIRGAFTMYKDAYRIGKFGRDEFVRTALRNRAPIVPFLTVGSAEIYPIFGKIEWSWWKRYSEWPFLPITATFPFLPFPLPSKWHTEFLAPIPLDRLYPPEAADDPATVRAISAELRALMQERLLAMKAKRKSIFWGEIFDGETAKVAPASVPGSPPRGAG